MGLNDVVAGHLGQGVVISKAISDVAHTTIDFDGSDSAGLVAAPARKVEIRCLDATNPIMVAMREGAFAAGIDFTTIPAGGSLVLENYRGARLWIWSTAIPPQFVQVLCQ
jgi:hypothetical protein